MSRRKGPYCLDGAVGAGPTPARPVRVYFPRDKPTRESTSRISPVRARSRHAPIRHGTDPGPEGVLGVRGAAHGSDVLLPGADLFTSVTATPHGRLRHATARDSGSDQARMVRSRVDSAVAIEGVDRHYSRPPHGLSEGFSLLHKRTAFYLTLRSAAAFLRSPRNIGRAAVGLLDALGISASTGDSLPTSPETEPRRRQRRVPSEAGHRIRFCQVSLVILGRMKQWRGRQHWSPARPQGKTRESPQRCLHKHEIQVEEGSDVATRVVTVTLGNCALLGEDAHYTVKQFHEPNVTLRDLQPDTAYLLRVRSITPLGPGPFSQEQEFRTLPPETGAPSGGVLVSIVFGILLFIGLVVGIFIFTQRKACCHQARPDYDISAFDGEEKVWLKPYVDLQPYEDPSRGVLEFTKELDVAYITMENVIGEGEFGEVYRGTLRLPGKERIVVAIKTLKSTYSDSQWWNFLREATIMGQFNHHNIVHLEGVVTKRKPMMIITEYMENGALDTFLRENEEKFSSVQLVVMLQGIASGMTYLSDRNYVHRDLAARNILVTHSLQCKVSDFGLSRILENDVEGTYETKGGKIPIRWTAPEAIAHRIFTSASDVWSYGIVMWEVLSFGDKPYGDMTNQEVMKSIEDGYRLPPPVDCPSILYELMKGCWSYDRMRRPRFQEIQGQLEHFISSPHLLRSVADFDPRVTLRLPSCSGSDGIPYQSIPEWLESIRMKRYILNFRTAGLDTMESILELTTEDLKKMGVSLPGHQKRILCSIQGFKE
nr:ephrin type-A receptor 1 [Chelonoidis abingdonii]